MADYISAELAATCAALGYYDGEKYHLDNHCIDVIKDVIKYLKRDDDNHTVRCFLGQTKLLQTDLIKILVEHCDNLEIWDVLLRLMINLTCPAFVIYNEQIPTEKTARTTYQQIVTYLQNYKIALTNENVWIAVKNRLSKILATESSERGEENEMIIERILVLIRNVLQIPPDGNEKRAENDASVHDEILFAFHSSGMVDLLLFIVSNHSEQQYHLQMLEIVSLMLREQNAKTLASSGMSRTDMEKEIDEARLLAVRQKETEQKVEKIKKYAGSRHSRFGGTFVVKNMKAIGDNQLLCHKPFQAIEALQFGNEKKKVTRPKNRRPMQDLMEERTSALSVRLFLKEFCVEFLKAAYNPVMKYARSCVMSGSQGEPNDVCCYLWAVRFFMEFNRHYKFEVKYVSETICNEIFYLVQRQMEEYYECILTDKKKIPLWSRRLHLALKAYQELLYTLMAMDTSADSGVRGSSKVIKSNVFYVPEYRETILSQLLCFDELKMSRQYLVDLITSVHIFLKMLEQFCGKGKRQLIIQKAKRKRQKGKKNKKIVLEEAPPQSLDERWDNIGPELSAVMREGKIPEVVPFDATLDIPIDDQKSDAMKRIQKLLRTKYLEEAVGLIRAAREVWPENDCFGKADMPVEEEFLALREIFFADLGVVEENPTRTTEGNYKENAENSLNHLSELDEEDEEEEAEPTRVYEDANFDFREFLLRFANVKVVKALGILLRQFDKNTNEVNHYVIKMLHRIAWDCKMPEMMFQASIFRVFQRILESKHPDHKELKKFAVFIIRHFGEIAARNRKVYMELLFWKTSRDATEIVNGYNAETDKKVLQAVWTDVEEDELRTLFMEHQTNNYPQDLINWIQEHLIRDDRTSRGIMKKLKELCLIVNSKSVRSEVQKRLPKEWSEEEVAQLTELWERLKDDDDPVDLIFDGLRIKRPKPKIKEKLLELGLAKDRKELRKKRSRKSNQGIKSSWETQSASNSEADESSDEGTGKSSGRNSAAPNKPTSKIPRKWKGTQSAVYTDAQLCGLLKDLIGKHMREPLEWIKESLQDVVDDRDEESSEGVPLVPLTDYTSTAIDTPSFQKLLRALGFSPPADEQESYWRIPANILTSTIQKRCNLIQNALEGNFVHEESEPQTRKKGLDSDNDNSESDEEDALERVKKFFARKEPEPSTSYKSESETSTNSDKKSSKRPKKGKKTKEPVNIPKIEEEEEEITEAVEESEEEKKISGGRGKMLDSSDSEPEVGNKDKNNQEEAKIEKKKFGGRLKVLDSSDSEMEIENKAENTQDEGKRNRSDSSDQEITQVKKRRLLDSDEEEESLATTEAKSKPAKVLEDDEEKEKTKEPRKPSRVIISDDEE